MATFEEFHYYKVTGTRTISDRGGDAREKEIDILQQEINAFNYGHGEDYDLRVKHFIAFTRIPAEHREEHGISAIDDRVYSFYQIEVRIDAHTWEDGYAIEDIFLKWERGEFEGQGKTIPPQFVIGAKELPYKV